MAERNQVTYEQAGHLKAAMCIGSCNSVSLWPDEHLVGCPYRNSLKGAEIVPNDDNEKAN